MDCTFSPEKDFQKLEQAVAALCGAGQLQIGRASCRERV